MKRPVIAAGIVLALISLYPPKHNAQVAALRFEVTVTKGLIPSPQNGRLFVVMSSKGQPEPRLTLGQTGLDASPVVGRAVKNFAAEVTGVLDDAPFAFSVGSLCLLPAGDH